MDDVEVRVRCLEAAVRSYDDSEYRIDMADHIMNRARRFYDFVTTPEMEIS